MQHFRAPSYVLQPKDLKKIVTPLDATLTKNRGVGLVMVNQTHATKGVCPERPSGVRALSPDPRKHFYPEKHRDSERGGLRAKRKCMLPTPWREARVTVTQALFVRQDFSLTDRCSLTTDHRASHGLAFGEKKPMGRSRAVRSPAGASRMTGIEFTPTDAVAMSPCEPPGITRLMFGCPVSEIVSAGSFAPTYICSSRFTSSLPSFERPRPIWCTPAACPGSTVRNSVCTRSVATFGSIVSVICSTAKFKLSATIATDSGSPTCLITPAATCARNSSTLIPAPIFFCNGSRRFDASTTRSALACSIRCETAASVTTSLSITKPGFTPVPTSPTPDSFA